MERAAKTSNKITMPSTWSGEMRALLALGIPMAATQFVHFFIHTIDVLMIGKLGPEDLAAATLGTVVYFALWMLGLGPVVAISPLVSQALGAVISDRKDARRSVRMALWAVFAIAPFVILLLLFTAPVMRALGQDPVLSEKAARYVLMLAFGWPFALGVIGLRNFLAAIGKTRVPFVIAVLTTALNAALNYLFIYGKFGFPRWELVGAGLASTLSYILCFLMFMVYIVRQEEARKFRLFERFWKADWDRFREVIKLGWPISLTSFFEGMLFNACALVVGVIGVLQLAAYQIALNVASLAFMIPMGLSMAGAIRMGLATGAQNYQAQKRAASTTLIASVCAMAFIALIVLIFGPEITHLYLKAEDTDTREVTRLVILFLPLVAAFMVFDAYQVGANQLLRGLKDVRWPMVLTAISYWVIGFPFALFTALKTPLGVNGVWYGMLIGLISAALFLGSRLYYLLRSAPAEDIRQAGGAD